MAAMMQCAQCKKFYKWKTGLSAHAKNIGHDVDFPDVNANLESTPVATTPKTTPVGTSDPATPQVKNDQEENIKMVTNAKEDEKTIGCPGCRKHEYREVDLILCQLSGTRSLHQLHDGTNLYRPPKTAKGKRLIALSPASALLLAQHKKEMAELNMMHGIVLSENDLVFSKTDRQPLLPGTISQAWSRLAQTHGFQNIRLHDARHTHASLLLKQGVHPKIVQERLGHANIAVTLDTYSHVTPGMQRAAAEKFDELITSKKS